ncbi:hypothetical protein OWV82_003740 [Melia azedarach]|uniref:Uncharacterized protein n=1 Tax=Melia azedarach TaxID=155640 RepID=A0ACC1YN37_MELAZ|nr:hypothetical protein OWV82_003740 [Melia azedarach]
MQKWLCFSLLLDRWDRACCESEDPRSSIGCSPRENKVSSRSRYENSFLEWIESSNSLYILKIASLAFGARALAIPLAIPNRPTFSTLDPAMVEAVWVAWPSLSRAERKKVWFEDSRVPFAAANPSSEALSVMMNSHLFSSMETDSSKKFNQQITILSQDVSAPPCKLHNAAKLKKLAPMNI